MGSRFTLEYWIDDNWYVGRLKEVPGIFSQGKTLKEMKKNIQDAYYLMMQDNEKDIPSPNIQTKEVQITV